MFKIICILIASFILLFLPASQILAQTPVSGISAGLKRLKEEKTDSNRIRILKEFLGKYNSDLASHSQYIITKADEYQIPWSMITAISGVESTFCRSIPYSSYNCWGWNNGVTRFKDYRHGIDTVSKTIRKSYFDKGLDTPNKMGRVYAPPSPAWGRNVQYFMNLIENSITPSIAE